MTHSVSREDVAQLVKSLRTGKGLTEETSATGGVWRDAWVHSAMQQAADTIESLLFLTVPEGYRLVPVEPTEEMISAAIPWFLAWQHMRPSDRRLTLDNAYRAMLSALPEVGGGSVPSGALSVVWEIIVARKAIYVQKALQHDHLSEDTLNERAKFDHTVEAFAYLEAELSKALTARMIPPATPDALSAGLDAEPSVSVCRVDFEADGYHVDDVAISGDLIGMFRLEMMDRDQCWGAVYLRDGRDLRFWFDGSKARSLKVTAEWEGEVASSPASPLPPPPAVVEGEK